MCSLMKNVLCIAKACLQISMHRVLSWVALIRHETLVAASPCCNMLKPFDICHLPLTICLNSCIVNTFNRRQINCFKCRCSLISPHLFAPLTHVNLLPLFLLPINRYIMSVSFRSRFAANFANFQIFSRMRMFS